MYGKYVTLSCGTRVFVWCVPSTPQEELYRMAQEKYTAFIEGKINSLNG
jgi:hypothetical protein